VSCDNKAAHPCGPGSQQSQCQNTSQSGSVPAYQCACSASLACPDPATQACSNSGYCFSSLPAFSSGTAELKPSSSGQNSAVLCLPAATPTATAGQQIQWSGAIFGRAGCPDSKFEAGCVGGYAGPTPIPAPYQCSKASDCCNNSCQCPQDGNGNCTGSGPYQCAPGVPACATGDCNASVHCPAGVGGMPPATEFEATMDSPGTPSDWYDVTAINGINIPIAVAPIPGTYSAGGNNSPYECGSPGAPSPSSGLQGCTWQIAAPPATSPPPWPTETSMRYVDPTSVTDTACTVDSDCDTAAGQICGIAYTPTAGITGNLEQMCGYPAGYWSPVSLCAQNGAAGPISGAFGCSTPLCNDTPPSGFPSEKMPSYECNADQSNFPVITCMTNADCSVDNSEGADMVCDPATDYCVPMVGTSASGACPSGSYYDPTSKLCLEGSGSPTPCTTDTQCSSTFTCDSTVPGQDGAAVCAMSGQCESNFDCPSSIIYSCSNGNNLSVAPPIPTATPTTAGTPVPTPTPVATPTPGQCVPSVWSVYGGTAFSPASFYNPATTNNQLATGFKAWVINSQPLAYPSAQPSPSLTANPNWISQAFPFESVLKTACPTAYSYQYDDPYSLFTCNSTSGTTQLGYTVTFCPAGSPNNPTFPTATPTP